MFTLFCSGILILGNAHHIDISGHGPDVYMSQVRLRNDRTVVLANGKVIRNKPGVYDDGGQFQVTVAHDLSRIWVQSDTNDNPREKGEMLRCRKN